MIPADNDNIPLCEAFEDYQRWNLSGRPSLPQFQAGEEGGKAWWKEAERRAKETLSKFKMALDEGKLAVKVFDPERNRSFAITSTNWRAHRPFVGWLSSIETQTIDEDQDDGLSPYNGLEPYVSKSEFDAWFAEQTGQPAAIVNRSAQPVRGYKFLNALKEWYRVEWVKNGGAYKWLEKNGRPPEATPSVANDQTAAREKHGRGVTRDMIRALRREFAPDEWKQPGVRANP